MALIITVVHILVSLALVFVVLLQKGSGADMGAAFGGSSQSVFGSRGSGSFLGKMTATLAAIFMLTSLTLAFFTTQKGGDVSVMGVPAAGSGAAGAKKPVAGADAQQTPVPPKAQQDSQKDSKAAEPPAQPAETGTKPVPTMEKSGSSQAPVPPKEGASAKSKEGATPPADGAAKPAAAPVKGEADGNPAGASPSKTEEGPATVPSSSKIDSSPVAVFSGDDAAKAPKSDSKAGPTIKPEADSTSSPKE